MRNGRAAPTPEFPGPEARRIRRPGWRDPRLLTGVVMIALSTALGSWAVARAGHTVPVYAAASTLVAGDELPVDTLLVRHVRLEDPAPYLLVEDGPPPELVVLRTVGAGELVPRSAVGDSADQEWRPVAITPGTALPTTVGPGSLVDLWLVPDPDDAAAAPTELAAGLVVAEAVRPTGAFAASEAPTLHVLVPRALLPTVLTALAGPGSVEVVAVPGSGA